MGSKDAERVAKRLPLLNRIVVDLFNKKHSNIIVLTAIEQPTPTPIDSAALPSVQADLSSQG
jgi:hypothetical protein